MNFNNESLSVLGSVEDSLSTNLVFTLSSSEVSWNQQRDSKTVIYSMATARFRGEIQPVIYSL